MTFEYQERMLGYYPQVIQTILEFQGIIYGESVEVEEIDKQKESVLSNAYLTTMGEDRIMLWEKVLGITPIAESTLDDRRDTILARIRGQGKLNTDLINRIVKTFTGGTANSWVSNGTLYVEITPPPDNKTYQFDNLEQELKKKVPAHLNLQVSRNYYTWEDIQRDATTWQGVKNNFNTWNDVLLFVPFN